MCIRDRNKSFKGKRIANFQMFVRSLSYLLKQRHHISKSHFSFKASTEDLKKLRGLTSAPIGDCKKALEENGGDFDKAVQYLKQKGLAQAQKRETRKVQEGVIAAVLHSDKTRAAYVQVLSETDFVAKTDMFLDYTQKLLEKTLMELLMLKDPKVLVGDELNTFLQNNLIYGKTSFFEARQELTAKLQENIEVRRAGILTVQDNGVVGCYVHRQYRDNIGLGCGLVSIESDKKATEDLAHFSENLAIQVFAQKPNYIRKEDIPADRLASEKERIRNELGGSLEGKPEDIINRIVEGKLKRFYEEEVLLEQGLLGEEDESQPRSIGQMLEELKGKVGGNLKIAHTLALDRGDPEIPHEFMDRYSMKRT
eukprot:TRINITY_DN1890_c0_g1_i5.p1 TRINITY_DN1890_c0_g1~~TRINITY_DN1890_c0_g1_i5.p1  ORF type:complete len:367 (-),score=44.76 TRINITY_DN1890_c0_g1_i5:40-1140(-)